MLFMADLMLMTPGMLLISPNIVLVFALAIVHVMMPLLHGGKVTIYGTHRPWYRTKQGNVYT